MKKSSCNGRSIYENCESNDRFISAMTRREMEQLLSKVKEDVQAQNKNVVFVDCSNGILYEARVVTYIGNVPKSCGTISTSLSRKKTANGIGKACWGSAVCAENIKNWG